VANLSKTLNINFYQNRSSIVEVMIKKIGVFFMPHSVLSDFRNCFAGTPNIKFALVIIKDFTTAETHRYTIL